MKCAKPLIALILTASLWAGCGGGGGPDRSGRASIAIEWPEPGRLIPKAAAFVTVRAVNSNNQPVGTSSGPVARPQPGQDSTTVITINNLAVGTTVTFIAEAWEADPTPGGLTPQARGQQAILIRNDAPNTFDISMASSVSQIAVFNGVTEVTGPLNVIAGEDIPLSAQARNAEGAMVLVDDSNWTWNRSGTTELTFNSQDSATGPAVTARGHATISAAIQIQEVEANKIRDVNIQVVEPLYSGAIDANIGGGITVPDIAAGPMESRAAADRLYQLEEGVDSPKIVKIYVADTLQLIPSPPEPWIEVPFFNWQDLVRNAKGIALAAQTDVTGTPVAVTTFHDTHTPANPQIEWTRILGMHTLHDISARRGFTYVLQEMQSIGFRITKIRDSDGIIVKELFVPQGITPGRITVDDEGGIYLSLGPVPPYIVKLDRNGDIAKFNPPSNFTRIADLDFDQGLIYVIDDDFTDTAAGRIVALGMNGRFIRTVPGGLTDTEAGVRLTAHNGAVFVLAGDPPRSPRNFRVKGARR